MKKSILTEGERGYWKSFRAVPFHPGSRRPRPLAVEECAILWPGCRPTWALERGPRALPVGLHRQPLTVKNLNPSRSLAEPCDLCLSKAAILKLWRYLRSTDSPNFFTSSEGLRSWPSHLNSRIDHLGKPLHIEIQLLCKDN